MERGARQREGSVPSEKRPSLRQLRCFCAVAETLHFGRAAERLGITQPSLSLQLRNLEETLALTLVERGRRCSLTPAGRELLPMARRSLETVEDLVRAAGTLQAGGVRRLRLGASPTIGPYLLPRVTQELRGGPGALGLVVRDAPSRALAEGCLEGRYDAILVQLPVAAEGLVSHRLFREPLVLAVPAGHRLAGRSAIRRSELAGEEVLALGSGEALHDQTARLCAETGARLRTDYEGDSLDALKEMTGLGLGVALLPAIYACRQVAPDDPEVRVLRFRGRGIWRSIGLAHRPASAGPDLERLGAVLRRVATADFGDSIAREG
jgi:LysR family transcriptional regulator, hydrogen peroxide-inducible genes activator